MTPENFCYWLQGYFEINDSTGETNILEEKQVEQIKNHLKLVFKKVTPEVKSKTDSVSMTEQIEQLMKKEYHQGPDYSPRLPSGIDFVKTPLHQMIISC